MATETIPRDASSISSVKDPLDLPGLVTQQRHTQVFTDESTSRAPTEPGDHRDLWTVRHCLGATVCRGRGGYLVDLFNGLFWNRFHEFDFGIDFEYLNKRTKRCVLLV